MGTVDEQMIPLDWICYQPYNSEVKQYSNKYPNAAEQNVPYMEHMEQMEHW